MQSKSKACYVPGTWSQVGANRRAARRTEVDRDHLLVSRGLVAEVRRLIASGTLLAPEQIFDRVEAALAASRADLHRLGNARVGLRVGRGVGFEDSAPLPPTLVEFGHRGNYHGSLPSMAMVGVLLAHLVPLPDAGIEYLDPAQLAEELHRRGEIWTLELHGVVHVFAAPGGEADRLLGGSSPRRRRGPVQVVSDVSAALCAC